jgi:hypothetical protein
MTPPRGPAAPRRWFLLPVFLGFSGSCVGVLLAALASAAPPAAFFGQGGGALPRCSFWSPRPRRTAAVVCGVTLPVFVGHSGPPCPCAGVLFAAPGSAAPPAAPEVEPLGRWGGAAQVVVVLLRE